MKRRDAVRWSARALAFAGLAAFSLASALAKPAPMDGGNWRYHSSGAITSTVFIAAGSNRALVTVRCMPGSEPYPGTSIRIEQAHEGSENPIMRITIDGLSVALETGPLVGARGLSYIFASLRADDPILDALPGSQSIAIETKGVPALLLPSGPEIKRVIEDCRQRSGG